MYYFPTQATDEHRTDCDIIRTGDIETIFFINSHKYAVIPICSIQVQESIFLTLQSPHLVRRGKLGFINTIIYPHPQELRPVHWTAVK